MGLDLIVGKHVKSEYVRPILVAIILGIGSSIFASYITSERVGVLVDITDKRVNDIDGRLRTMEERVIAHQAQVLEAIKGIKENQDRMLIKLDRER